MSHIFSVSEITRAVKEVLEGEFPLVWVRGQVSNLARPGSGHVYFSLKDESALLNVVWFKSNQWLGCEGEVNPLTGEVCEDGPADTPLNLENGQEVLVAGRISVYGPRGAYQLIAELVQTQGKGDLHERFEALKQELFARGYFDQARKRPLPSNPSKVAVVTAPAGAAIRDFITVAQDRGGRAEIRVYPTLVQGDAAPKAIVAALDKAQRWADCVALVRGGGSLEDLWAFNALEVAEAVYTAIVPVICGVGHEVDVSIADLVADVRAATPSHAAQLLWPARSELAQRLDEAEMRLHGALNGSLERAESKLARLEQLLAWRNPQQDLARASEKLSALTERLRAAGNSALDSPQRSLDRLELRLDGLNPERPLQRGYSLVTVAKTGRFLRSPADVASGDTLDIRVAEGQVRAVVSDQHDNGKN